MKMTSKFLSLAVVSVSLGGNVFAQGYVADSAALSALKATAPATRTLHDIRSIASITASGNTSNLYLYILAHPSSAQLKAGLWQAVQSARLDQQSGSSAVSSGGTALVSKGVASLLGVAIESGAVSKTTAANVTTLTVSTSELAALISGGKMPACSLVDDACTTFGSILRGTSVGISFDVAASNTASSSSLSTTAQNALTGGSGSSFSGFNVREDLHVRKNKVDASAFAAVFSAAATKAKLIAYGEAFTTFADLISKEPLYIGEYDEKGTPTKDGALGACVKSLQQPSAVGAEVDRLLEACERNVSDIVQGKPDLLAALQTYAAAASAYYDVRDAALSSVLFNTTFSISYDFTRAAEQPAQPSLSSLTLVYSGRYSPTRDASRILQVTGNASTSLYNNLEGSSVSRFRSAQSAVQLDYTATPSTSAVQAALSGGYYFQYMVANGLLSLPSTAFAPGTTIPISGNASQVLNTKGPIHIGQAKVVLSIKNKNISLPFAVTFASRSDLLHASRITGNFGISYDFSTLLPSSK